MNEMVSLLLELDFSGFEYGQIPQIIWPAAIRIIIIHCNLNQNAQMVFAIPNSIKTQDFKEQFKIIFSCTYALNRSNCFVIIRMMSCK